MQYKQNSTFLGHLVQVIGIVADILVPTSYNVFMLSRIARPAGELAGVLQGKVFGVSTVSLLCATCGGRGRTIKATNN